MRKTTTAHGADSPAGAMHAHTSNPNRSRADRGTRPTAWVLAAVMAVAGVASASAETWRGLTIAPEHRCSPYERKRDYPYPQSIEQDIVRALGTVYGPYTGTCFGSTGDTDIEHLVATSEAHDSGLCAADPSTKRQFATDLRNLTLASPRVNRHQKSGKDAGEWVPERNRCWFAGSVVEVKRAYGLTADRREAEGPRADPPGVHEHGDGAEGVPDDAGVRRGHREGERRWRRCARALRRQPERQDHVQGGAPPRDRARAPLAPGVSVHARRRWRWRRLRVATGAASDATNAICKG